MGQQYHAHTHECACVRLRNCAGPSEWTGRQAEGGVAGHRVDAARNPAVIQRRLIQLSLKPGTYHPPSALLASLYALSLRRAQGMNDTTRHDEPRKFTVDHHPGTDGPTSRARPALDFTPVVSPFASPVSSRHTGPPLFLCQRVPPLRPCSPTWLRSIHRPSSGHIDGVLPARCPGKCKMDVLRSRIGPGDRKPDSIPLRPARGQRTSYNMTASSKIDKSISRMRAGGNRAAACFDFYVARRDMTVITAV